MAKTDDRKSIRCSFCGKHQDQVRRLIAGPGAYICNECVQLCMSILEDESDLIQDSAAGEIPVCRQGRGLDFDEDLAKRILTEDEVEIRVRMGEGDASCTCWGCDITYDYIKINGDYRT